MGHDTSEHPAQDRAFEAGLSRREILALSATFGSLFVAGQGFAVEDPPADAASQSARRASAKKYPAFKKSINLWALPYPQDMSLRECLEICHQAGFDAVEINFALEGDLSPESTDDDIRAIGKMAREIGIEISGLCSFLFWPYSFTHRDAERRSRGLELARMMIHAAELLETPNLLVVPGAVYIPWLPEEPSVPYDLALDRAKQGVETLVPLAERAGVYLNIENIFFNGFLMSPQEMITFVDQFGSPHVKVHFDTGNIMQYQFPEHWIALLGNRIQNVHLKEASKKVSQATLDTFRPLLDGTTDWPAVLDAFQAANYEGYLTFEYFNPFPHWPEALVYHTSDALDRMLGRTA